MKNSSRLDQLGIKENAGGNPNHLATIPGIESRRRDGEGYSEFFANTVVPHMDATIGSGTGTSLIEAVTKITRLYASVLHAAYSAALRCMAASYKGLPEGNPGLHQEMLSKVAELKAMPISGELFNGKDDEDIHIMAARLVANEQTCQLCQTIKRDAGHLFVSEALGQTTEEVRAGYDIMVKEVVEELEKKHKPKPEIDLPPGWDSIGPD